MCSIVIEGKKYDLLSSICARLSQKGRSTICCHQFVLDCHRREEVRFVATNLCSMVTEGRKGRSTICCHQFVLDCHRRQEVRFVATNLCSIVTEGKMYDLLSSICARLSQKGRNTICCPPKLYSLVIEGKKYDFLPPICAGLSQKGRSMICCHQLVLDCHRREEVRFVTTNLSSIITQGTICCHECHRREDV